MDKRAQSRIIQPGGFAGGRVRVPGDRSISHRVAVMAGLAAGTSEITGFSDAADCLDTLRAMESFGARAWFEGDGDQLRVQGTGGKTMEPAGPLDVGNSATGMRLLAGLCAGAPIDVTLTGDETFAGQSMEAIRTPLERMGAKIELSEGGCAPMRIRGGGLKGIEYCLPVGSAQVKTCCILAGLRAEGDTTVMEPVPTRDHTERMLRGIGVALKVDGRRITVKGYGAKGPRWAARAVRVPRDFSAAAYWLAAAAAAPGVTVRAEEVGLNPRRTAFLGVLGRMGAKVDIEPLDWGGVEPVGNVTVSGAALRGVDVAGDEVANLVDEVPLVAALGALAKGRTTLKDASGFLSAREGNLLGRVAENLEALGVLARATDGGLTVEGPSRIEARGPLKTHGDARMAMTLAVLGIFAESPLCVGGVSCVDGAYPGFWKQLATMGVNVE
ncbi:MAG: 3-phosphoshikimate 1-carboxyvinyltransferase [Kiritimatiellae bacterium]|nr:3-phosphoshikimate 1-carboxyvinyltransferase [Kiritimatiellia bacterium]